MASIISAGTTSGTALNMAGDTSGVLQLATNGSTTALTIDTSQNVGIGTTSPDKKLKVEGSTLASATIEVGVTNTQSSTILNLVTTGTTYSYSAVGGSTSWYYGNKTVALGTDSANPIQFIANSSERMRIFSSGNIGMGVTTDGSLPSSGIWAAPSYDSTNASGIAIGHSNGSASGTTYVGFVYNSSKIGSITQNGTTAIAYNTSSDYRLKENIAPMTGALNKVTQLKPVTYTWKSDNSQGQGFIAHELQEVVPECVTGAKDAVDAEGNPQYQGVDTSFLVATLTAAIQEQQTIINDLKARITALEGAA
jgi:hypothetical protein